MIRGNRLLMVAIFLKKRPNRLLKVAIILKKRPNRLLKVAIFLKKWAQWKISAYRRQDYKTLPTITSLSVS